MKTLLFIFLSVCNIAYASNLIEMDLESDNTINIDQYSSEGESLLIYLPSERGLGKAYVPVAQQLSLFGTDVWALDLHASYMIPKHRSSLDKIDINDLVELIEKAKDKGFDNIYFITSGRGAQLALKTAYGYQLKHPKSNLIKGHIFHSPHLIYGTPALGAKALYLETATISNLPIYLLIPQFGTKYFRSEEITNTLQSGGSVVFTHRLDGVNGGFHMRDEKDLNEKDLTLRSNLADLYTNAISLIKTAKPAPLSEDKNHLKQKPKRIVSDPELLAYHGTQGMPLKLTTLDGALFDLKDLDGKVVLLNFWASWCKPCVKEIPSMVRLKQRLDDQPFEIITINIGESSKEIKEFKKKVPFDLPILLDTKGEAVKNWGVYAFPSNFLLDRSGFIRYGYRGALEWDSESVVGVIQTLL